MAFSRRYRKTTDLLALDRLFSIAYVPEWNFLRENVIHDFNIVWFSHMSWFHSWWVFVSRMKLFSLQLHSLFLFFIIFIFNLSVLNCVCRDEHAGLGVSRSIHVSFMRCFFVSSLLSSSTVHADFSSSLPIPTEKISVSSSWIIWQHLLPPLRPQRGSLSSDLLALVPSVGNSIAAFLHSSNRSLRSNQTQLVAVYHPLNSTRPKSVQVQSLCIRSTISSIFFWYQSPTIPFLSGILCSCPISIAISSNSITLLSMCRFAVQLARLYSHWTDFLFFLLSLILPIKIVHFPIIIIAFQSSVCFISIIVCTIILIIF